VEKVIAGAPSCPRSLGEFLQCLSGPIFAQIGGPNRRIYRDEAGWPGAAAGESGARRLVDSEGISSRCLGAAYS
jgi:hypothetical protein